MMRILLEKELSLTLATSIMNKFCFHERVLHSKNQMSQQTFQGYRIIRGDNWGLIGVSPSTWESIPPPKKNFLLTPRKQEEISSAPDLNICSRADCRVRGKIDFPQQ